MNKMKKNPQTAPRPHHHSKSEQKTVIKNSKQTDFAKVNYFEITDDGQRLDNFLLTLLKGVPRSHIYKLIRDKEITVNKKKVKPEYRLQTADVVRVAPIRVASRDEPIVGDELAQGLLGRIVYEDEGLIVLDKPSNLAVHGGSGVSVGVIEAMRVATGKPYLELVHRIDKETSGLLLIAKKRSVLKALQDNFREKTIFKDYLCLCVGDVTKSCGRTAKIDKPLLKYLLENGERRVKVHKDGKPSQTMIEVLKVFEMDGQTVSVVKASPLTGRTHQIRVHLASVGHPLLGDEKYLNRPAPSVSRLCLHAWRLTTGQHSFVATVPSDIHRLMGSFELKMD